MEADQKRRGKQKGKRGKTSQKVEPSANIYYYDLEAVTAKLNLARPAYAQSGKELQQSKIMALKRATLEKDNAHDAGKENSMTVANHPQSYYKATEQPVDELGCQTWNRDIRHYTFTRSCSHLR